MYTLEIPQFTCDSTPLNMSSPPPAVFSAWWFIMLMGVFPLPYVHIYSLHPLLSAMQLLHIHLWCSSHFGLQLAPLFASSDAIWLVCWSGWVERLLATNQMLSMVLPGLGHQFIIRYPSAYGLLVIHLKKKYKVYQLVVVAVFHGITADSY